MNIIINGKKCKCSVKTPTRVHKMNTVPLSVLLAYMLTYDNKKLGWRFSIENECIFITTPTHKIIWDIYRLKLICEGESQLPINHVICAIDRICDGLENFEAFLKLFDGKKMGDHYLLVKNGRQLRLCINDNKITVEGENNGKWLPHPICAKFFREFYELFNI